MNLQLDDKLEIYPKFCLEQFYGNILWSKNKSNKSIKKSKEKEPAIVVYSKSAVFNEIISTLKVRRSADATLFCTKYHKSNSKKKKLK
jgi:hypothetical protein